mmetsp:Transcript_9350/g.56987  ORF Transcript_9350/g.56987 Transcript_9350/m.56987 type:complete len:245 (+) Transcript_9350:2464-3198(+)
MLHRVLIQLHPQQAHAVHRQFESDRSQSANHEALFWQLPSARNPAPLHEGKPMRILQIFPSQILRLLVGRGAFAQAEWIHESTFPYAILDPLSDFDLLHPFARANSSPHRFSTCLICRRLEARMRLAPNVRHESALQCPCFQDEAQQQTSTCPRVLFAAGTFHIQGRFPPPGRYLRAVVGFVAEVYASQLPTGFRSPLPHAFFASCLLRERDCLCCLLLARVSWIVWSTEPHSPHWFQPTTLSV